MHMPDSVLPKFFFSMYYINAWNPVFTADKQCMKQIDGLISDSGKYERKKGAVNYAWDIIIHILEAEENT